MTPDFEFCKPDILKMVYEKEDLLADHGGKNREYNYYRHAGVVTPREDKGTRLKENPPVELRSNLP